MISSHINWARLAMKSKVSHIGPISPSPRSNSTRLIFFPTSVVPGSITTSTRQPSVSKCSRSLPICVDFPAPSGPSITMNRPANFLASSFMDCQTSSSLMRQLCGQIVTVNQERNPIRWFQCPSIARRSSVCKGGVPERSRQKAIHRCAGCLALLRAKGMARALSGGSVWRGGAT